MNARSRALVLGAVVAAASVALGPAPVRGEPSKDDYTNPAYLQHDLDNIFRSTVQGAPVQQVLNPAYFGAMFDAGSTSWLHNVSDQLDGLGQGRVYGGLGHLIPGGAVGDPLAYAETVPTPVNFISRTGPIWGCICCG